MPRAYQNRRTRQGIWVAMWWPTRMYLHLRRQDRAFASVVPPEPGDLLAPYSSLEYWLQIQRLVDADKPRAARLRDYRHIKRRIKSGLYTLNDAWLGERHSAMWKMLLEKYAPQANPAARMAYGLAPEETVNEQSMRKQRRSSLSTLSQAAIVDGNIACENYWGICVCPSCARAELDPATGELVPTAPPKGKNVYGGMLQSIAKMIAEGKW